MIVASLWEMEDQRQKLGDGKEVTCLRRGIPKMARKNVSDKIKTTATVI